VRVLRTPVRSPQANAICERLVSTLRRECLDFIMPLGERHLRQVLRSWVTHYNHARVHMSLGPGVPAPLTPSPPENPHRHRLPTDQMIRSKAVLGGLHDEYWLEKIAEARMGFLRSTTISGHSLSLSPNDLATRDARSGWQLSSNCCGAITTSSGLHRALQFRPEVRTPSKLVWPRDGSR
jgi:hypothetical protein